MVVNTSYPSLSLTSGKTILATPTNLFVNFFTFIFYYLFILCANNNMITEIHSKQYINELVEDTIEYVMDNFSSIKYV